MSLRFWTPASLYCQAHTTKRGMFPYWWGIEDASFAPKTLALERAMAKGHAALMFPF